MAVCELIQLILVQTVSVFGCLGASAAARGAVLANVVWVWRAVSDWPRCWGRVMFVVRVNFRAVDVVIGMGRVSVALIEEAMRLMIDCSRWLAEWLGEKF